MRLLFYDIDRQEIICPVRLWQSYSSTKANRGSLTYCYSELKLLKI